MMKTLQRRIAMGVGLSLVVASTAFADKWNERTELTFSEAVMVPGATLQPGAYVFQLVDSLASRHIVEIRDAKGQPVATIHAVPLKRLDAKGDTVLRFSPTDEGKPPALKGWFYPGSLYGHQFVYSDAEARAIASRTRTVVLASDVDNGGLKKEGTLHIYDSNGGRGVWTPDDETTREWDTWNRDRMANADRDGKSESDGVVTDIARVVGGTREMVGTRVSLKDVRVEQRAAHGGFVVKHNGDAVYVMPEKDAAMSVSNGDTVTIEGVLKQAPPEMDASGDQLPDATNEDIYVMASSIKK